MSTGCQKFLEDSKNSVSMAFNNYLDVLNSAGTDPWYKATGKCVALIMTMPLALIEGVVRGVFALLATPILFFLPDGKARNWYNEHIFSPLALGSLYSFTAAPLAIGTFFMGVSILMERSVDACSTAAMSKIAKMPPNIWCCCKGKTAPNPT